MILSKKKKMATPVEETRHANVILSAAYLMPVSGKTITAHSTRASISVEIAGAEMASAP